MNSRLQTLLLAMLFLISISAFAGPSQCEWEPQDTGSMCGDNLRPAGQFGVSDLVNALKNSIGGDHSDCDTMVICADPLHSGIRGYNEHTPQPAAGMETILRNSYSVDTSVFLDSGVQRLRFASFSYKENSTHLLYEVRLDLLNYRETVYLALWDSWNGTEKLVPLAPRSYVRVGSNARAGGAGQYLYVVTGASSGLLGGQLVMRSAGVPVSELGGAIASNPLIISPALMQQQYFRYGYLGDSTTDQPAPEKNGTGFEPIPVSALHDFKIQVFDRAIRAL